MMSNAFFGLGVGVEIKDHIIGRYLIQDTLNSGSIAEVAMIMNVPYLKDQYSYVGFFYGYQMYSRVSIRINPDQFDTVYLRESIVWEDHPIESFRNFNTLLVATNVPVPPIVIIFALGLISLGLRRKHPTLIF